MTDTPPPEQPRIPWRVPLLCLVLIVVGWFAWPVWDWLDLDPMPFRALHTGGKALAIVAFIHDQKTQAESAVGGRRSVEVSDLQTGNAAAGKKYFDTACTRCHSATGDLAGLATRLQGLQLLQRMLYPQGGGPNVARAQSTVTVTTRDGGTISGALAYRDEFAVALRDAEGRYRSFAISEVEVAVDNPLQGHIDQLARYTDEDMHDVITFLHTLR